ncbi:MAG: tetratricopeptide repeat protein [Planctomycetota bacterium]
MAHRLLAAFALVFVVGLAVAAPARAETAADAFDQGEAAREEMRMGDAAQAYWRAIALDPGFYRAHVRFQDASLASGSELDSLMSDYELLERDFPAHGPVIHVHGLRLKPPAERIPLLEALLKQGESSDLHLELGRAKLAMGDAPAAVKELEKALATAPGDRPDVLLLMAEAEMAAGAVDSARKRLEGAVGANPQFWLGHLALARLHLLAKEFEKADQRARTVLEQRPSYIAAFLVRSEARVGLQDIEGAMGVLDSAARIAADARPVILARADLHGRAETEAGYNAALTLYQILIDRSSEDVHALYGKGWALERLKKWPEAEEAYREILAFQPAHLEALNSVGYTLLKQGRVSEAQVQFKKALAVDESFVAALLNLGSTLDMQSKWGDAIKVYESVLKMREHKDNLRALVNCAFDHEENGSFPKAAKLLEQAHAVAPGDANILVWLGDNMYFQKKWKDAEKRYREAIALDDKLFFAWRGLGFALMERGRIDDAIAALEKAYALKPDALELLILMGDLYLEEERLEEAFAKFKAYRDAGGDDPDVLDALDELAEELGK